MCFGHHPLQPIPRLVHKVFGYFEDTLYHYVKLCLIDFSVNSIERRQGRGVSILQWRGEGGRGNYMRRCIGVFLYMLEFFPTFFIYSERCELALYGYNYNPITTSSFHFCAHPSLTGSV